MKHSKGSYLLPNHIISKVFLRGNRVYYSDSDTKVKNLFYSDPSDEFPDPFVRVAILDWLNERKRVKGPSGILGFHKVSEMVKDLTILGHGIERVEAELKTLIKHTLVLSESQDANNIDIEELISINSPGYIHLELLRNIDYLSSCSEDVWYNKEDVAISIAERISGNTSYSHLSRQTSLANSESLINYLEEYCEDYYLTQEKFLTENHYKLPLNLVVDPIVRTAFLFF